MTEIKHSKLRNKDYLQDLILLLNLAKYYWTWFKPILVTTIKRMHK